MCKRNITPPSTLKEKKMKLKFLMIFLLVPIVVKGSTPSHRDYMSDYLPLVTAYLEADYPGPLAEDLGSMALARQILEDGLHKGPRYSVAGIGVGSPNKEIVTANLFHWLRVGRASDYEGGTFYSFQGPQAAVCSAVIISHLFDSYVYRFLPKHTVVWDLAKELSAHVYATQCEGLGETYKSLGVGEIVRRANRMYGPNSEAVERIRDANNK
jgi:hypothetical protein